MLSPHLFAVPYKSHSEFVESHDKYNIVVSFLFVCFLSKTLSLSLLKLLLARHFYNFICSNNSLRLYGSNIQSFRSQTFVHWLVHTHTLSQSIFAKQNLRNNITVFRYGFDNLLVTKKCKTSI